MNVLVTGAGGLVGSEAVKFFAQENAVFGIDNDMRKDFFGAEGSVKENLDELSNIENFTNYYVDIRNAGEVNFVFKLCKPDVIIHCAAQPSHDKAASIPILDFEVNANGTLNLLEATRNFCPDAVFIHVSTNKVYGDGPNLVQLDEEEKRFDFARKFMSNDESKMNGYSHNGFNENFSIDQCMHSLFGASKLAGDVMAQEYGRYFNMNVGVFRGGCLTGPKHAGVELHGFLSYIVKCAMTDRHYTIFGYKGKQVRDQIHSTDVISAFNEFIKNPKKGEVYNIGGGKENSASILEIIDMIEELSGKRLNYTLSEKNREGDHICYYTDLRKLKSHFPTWKLTKTLKDIIEEIIEVHRGEK